MKQYREAATLMDRLRTEKHDAILRSPRRRNGHATVMLFLEVFLLGLVIWGVVVGIPLMLVPDHASASADAQRVNLPIMRFSVTSSGQELWSQLGTSEIVSMDLATRQSHRIYRRHNFSIGNWSVSQDGATFLLSNDDCDVQILRNQRLILFERLPEPSRLLTALSSSGQAAIRISGGTAARFWDLSTDEPVQTDFVLLESAERIAIDSTGETLAVSAGQAGLHIYDVKTGVRLRTLAENNRLPKDTVFSADGKWLAVIRGLAIILYDVHSGEIAWTVQIPGPDPFFSISFSPDGKWLAASGVTAGIQIIDCSDGKLHCQLPSNSTMHRVAFSPSNDTLYSGCTDGSIRIWSLSAGRETDQLSPFDATRKNAR